MEFWGVEVKAGEPLKVIPEHGRLIHLSQAALGEVKDFKGAKHIPLRVKIDDKSLILGSLSGEERPQLMLELVFEKEFELSHDWKNGNVYFLGYTAENPTSEHEDFSDDSDDEPMDALQTGNIKQNLGDVNDAKTAAASKVRSKKEELTVSDEDEDSEFDSDDSDSEDALGGSFSSEEDMPKEKEQPKKEQQAKKRPVDVAQKAPVFNKKAKTSTPNNTGNKNAYKANPLPSNKSGKVPASNRSNEKNKKPNGQMSRK